MVRCSPCELLITQKDSITSLSILLVEVGIIGSLAWFFGPNPAELFAHLGILDIVELALLQTRSRLKTRCSASTTNCITNFNVNPEVELQGFLYSLKSKMVQHHSLKGIVDGRCSVSILWLIYNICIFYSMSSNPRGNSNGNICNCWVVVV